MLIAPDLHTKLETPYGNVNVSKGAVALVIVSKEGLTVFDLHDRIDQSVCIEQNGMRSISLTPGRSVTFSNGHKHSFEQINPAGWLGIEGC